MTLTIFKPVDQSVAFEGSLPAAGLRDSVAQGVVDGSAAKHATAETPRVVAALPNGDIETCVDVTRIRDAAAAGNEQPAPELELACW